MSNDDHTSSDAQTWTPHCPGTPAGARLAHEPTEKVVPVAMAGAVERQSMWKDRLLFGGWRGNLENAAETIHPSELSATPSRLPSMTQESITADDVERVLRLAEQMPREPDTFLDSTAARIGEVASTYDQHSDAIDAACAALSDLASHELANQSASDMLSAANRIVGALDLIQQVHPFIGVAVLALRAVVSLELRRRENDQRVAALVVQACSMMFDLIELRDVVDPNVLAPNGQVFQGRLQTTLADAAKQIHDCGNAIDRYYKTKKISRFFKSSQWEDVFVSFATEFARLKQEIQSSLAIRTSLRLDDNLSRMTLIGVKLDAILALLHRRTALEMRVSHEIERRGGFDICLKGAGDMREIAASVYQELADAAPQSESGALDYAALLTDLRTPLELQILDNRPVFDAMIETVSTEISELQDKVSTAEERIVSVLSSGPYKRVKDPHLRFIWKAMNWKFTVRTKDFLPTIHDYFVDCLRQSMTARRRAYIAEYSNLRPSSPDSTKMASSTDHDSIYAFLTDEDERPPALSPTDEWCLQYLNVASFPALKDAFDNDANGLISVREVNLFSTVGLPSEWNILHKLAYAAAGHHIELVRYRNQIRALLHEMSDLSLEVRPENRGLVVQYLDSQEITRAKAMVSGIVGYEGKVDVELDRLVVERMITHQVRLHKRLQSIKYEIPASDFISLLLDKGRVEQIIAPILHVLLLRHASIIRLAKVVILDRRELEVARSSLAFAFELVTLRVRRLIDSFRQQAMSPQQRFETFSHGLYAFLFQPESTGAHNDYRFFLDRRYDSTDIVLEQINASALRYTCPDPAQEAYGVPGPVPAHSNGSLGPRATFQEAVLLVLDQIRRSKWSYLQLRKSQMRQYLLLSKPAMLQSMSHPDGPQYLHWPQTTILQQLRDYLSPSDIAYCDALADLELRKSTVIHKGLCCNGCRRMPIIHDRYDCLECAEGEYRLCMECIHVSPDNHCTPHPLHSATHNLILHSREVSKDWCGRIRRRALEQLHLSIPKSMTDHSGLQFGIEGTLLCDECGTLMPADFYCCLECPLIGSPCCICLLCVRRRKFRAAGTHARDHWMVLVRDREAPIVTGIKPSAPDTELESSVSAFDAVNARMDEVNSRLDQLNTRVDRITAMLEVLLQRGNST